MTRFDSGIGLCAVVFGVACASTTNNSAPENPTPVRVHDTESSTANRSPARDSEIDLREVREQIHETAFVSLTGDENTRGRYATLDDTEGNSAPREAIGDLENPQARTTWSRMKVTVTARDRTNLGVRQVSSRVHSRYLASMKRCHEQVLKEHPRAAGELTVRFTVGKSGRATKAQATGFDANVADCIRLLITGWRFPSPTNTAGSPSPARFELGIVAKPGS